MDTIIHDLRVSIRALLNRPGFTLVAVATLALGLGATTALFSVVYGVLLRPLPYAESERIVSVWQTARNNPGPNPDGSVSHMNFVDWKAGGGQLRVGRALFRRDVHRQRRQRCGSRARRRRLAGILQSVRREPGEGACVHAEEDVRTGRASRSSATDSGRSGWAAARCHRLVARVEQPPL